MVSSYRWESFPRRRMVHLTTRRHFRFIGNPLRTGTAACQRRCAGEMVVCLPEGKDAAPARAGLPMGGRARTRTGTCGLGDRRSIRLAYAPLVGPQGVEPWSTGYEPAALTAVLRARRHPFGSAGGPPSLRAVEDGHRVARSRPCTLAGRFGCQCTGGFPLAGRSAACTLTFALVYVRTGPRGGAVTAPAASWIKRRRYTWQAGTARLRTCRATPTSCRG